MATSHPARTTYRHGDLRQALVDAGIDLAREGGPSSVVLREATRRAGVSPAAAYRHFADRDALVRAVANVAQSALADAIVAAQARATRGIAGRRAARARFRAVGAGYIAFACREPNLFRTAFSASEDLGGTDDPARAGKSGKTPYQLLADALDGLVGAGVLPARRRKGAEFLAWSAVHGFAMLAIDGPLRGLSPTVTDTIAERVIDMVEAGI